MEPVQPTVQSLQEEIDTLRVKLENKEAESTDETHKVALDHAWAHFAYHANQRLVTFRFFLIAVAIFVGAYLKTMSDESIWVSSVIAILGLVFSYVFLRLDLRNKDLIGLSEAVLIKEEKILKEKVNYPEISIIEKSNSFEARRKLIPKTYGQSLKFLFNIMIILFLVAIFLPHSPDVASLFYSKVHQQEQGKLSRSGLQLRKKNKPITIGKKDSQSKKDKGKGRRELK